MNISRCIYHGTIVAPQKKRNKHESRLEDLPNELLSFIFKYLNARDLFRSFHNLNYRFNELLQSFDYLRLTFHMKGPINFKTNEGIFSHSVYSLSVDEWIDFNPKYFRNVRRLKLISPIPTVLQKLKGNVMPFLEHLSVVYIYTMYEINLLHNEIFSNGFPNLFSCELYVQDGLLTIQESKQSPVIRSIKTKLINLMIYKIILQTCPNLYFLKFSMHSSDENVTNNIKHINLKYMIIDLTNLNWSDDDDLLNTFLSSVQNIEQLEIHRRNYSHDILEYFQSSNWLKSIITEHLPLLRIFKVYFYLSKDEELRNIIDENILRQIQEDFSNVHNGPYKAQLIICRESK